MNTAGIETRLKAAMGLDAATIGSSAIARAARGRMSALGWTDADAYARMLDANPGELQQLVEAVVVPETWFFRHREAFDFLGGPVLSRWLAEHCVADVLRVLSLPCSTGEEPYTIAMTLLDQGLPAARFRIDACDISSLALATARAAHYGRNSFRVPDLSFRDRYFSAVGSRWKLRDDVRERIHFSQRNILEFHAAAEPDHYDVIFCRNLLIYFDRVTQDRALAALTRLLAPRGVLFVGPSETGLLLSHGLESSRAPLTFSFTRPEPSAAPAPSRTSRAAPRRSSPAAPRPKPRAAAHAVPPAPRPVPAAPRSTEEAGAAAAPLDAIVALADQGHVAEAAHQCEALLKMQGSSAGAFFLLGVLRDAAGQHRAAAELFRKAVYLDPAHHDALMHLSYHARRNGELAASEAFAARARRAADAHTERSKSA